MSFRNPFRRKTVLSLKDTSNNKEKDFIRKISTVSSLRLQLSSKSKFRIVENLTFSPSAATLELIDYPGHVMRARGMQLIGEKKSHDQEFTDDSTFFLMSDLWFDGFIAFESTKTAAHYIRLKDNKLELARYDGSGIFKEECSFKMESSASCKANDRSFQNNWIEEDGNIGLQLDKNSLISPKLSPSTRSTRFLKVPVAKNDSTSLTEADRTSQSSSPRSIHSPGRKSSVTFRRQQFLSASRTREFVSKYNNSGYEDSPVCSHRLPTEYGVSTNENTSNPVSVDRDMKLKAQRELSRHEAATKGKLMVQNQIMDDTKISNGKADAGCYNDTVNDKLENMKFEYENCREEMLGEYFDRDGLKDQSFKKETSKTKKVDVHRLKRTLNGYKEEYMSTDEVVEREIDIPQNVSTTPTSVYLYCLADDNDYYIKNNGSARTKAEDNVASGLFERSRSNSGVVQSSLTGRLVAKRMEKNYLL